MTGLDWYHKLHDMRTEWTHFTGIFIAGDDADPDIVVDSFRPKKIAFEEKNTMKIPEFLGVLREAISELDKMADYILLKEILPKLNPNQVIRDVERDESGFPVLTDDHRFVPRERTIREIVSDYGIQLD